MSSWEDLRGGAPPKDQRSRYPRRATRSSNLSDPSTWPKFQSAGQMNEVPTSNDQNEAQDINLDVEMQITPSRGRGRGRGGPTAQGYIRVPGVPRDSMRSRNQLHNEQQRVLRNPLEAPVPREPMASVYAEPPVSRQIGVDSFNLVNIAIGESPSQPKIPGIMEESLMTPALPPITERSQNERSTTPEDFVQFGGKELSPPPSFSFAEDMKEMWDDPTVSSTDETPLAQPFSNNTSQGNGNGKRQRYWNFSQWQGKRKRDGGSAENLGVENKKVRSGGPKTASMLLHEKCTDLVFNYSEMIGPAHDPSFNVTVVYPPTGKQYLGTGRSKKLSKQNVAEIILTDLGIPLPPKDVGASDSESSFSKGGTPESVQRFLEFITPPPTVVLHDEPKQMDFSSDEVLSTPTFNAPEYPAMPNLLSPNLLKRLRNIQHLEENSVAAFNCLIAPVVPTYEMIEDSGLPHEKVFTIKLTCKDSTLIEKSFVGTGPSKKRAKADAARQALICVLGFECFRALAVYSLRPKISQDPSASPMDQAPVAMKTVEELDNEWYLGFPDHVANLVIEKYEELMKTDEPHLPQKVLAGVVMTTAYPLIENSRVIAVTTGTKCIEGDFMSGKGLALNDCHAEILATRCVRDFIYSELDKLVVDTDPITSMPMDTDMEDQECIFEVTQESEDGVSQFKLKDGIKFHLYISTSPCGDARIFSPRGIDSGEDMEAEPPGDDLMDSHPNRINRGVLRAKIEAGEGTIPVANLNTGPQTWDAIISGSALHTMSCSDKVCRWNVVGMQGALLANLMSPIFYSSIILGSLHHPVHFRRALITRIEKLEPTLVLPYKVNKPKLLMVSKEAKRRVKKSPNYAVTWSSTWSSHEVISAPKGCCDGSGVSSRLAKRVQFLRFLKIYKNKTGRRDKFADLSYGDAKGLAHGYQNAKNSFSSLMQECSFGTWISKPIEQDSFYMD